MSTRTRRIAECAAINRAAGEAIEARTEYMRLLDAIALRSKLRTELGIKQ